MGSMEQPASSHPQPEGKESTTTQSQKKRRLPSPRELIAHYESQGMETQEASVKVIEDLQNALFRVVTSGRGGSGRGRGNNNNMAEISRKLDVVNSRVLKVDKKLDSKPGYAETLAIGVASGAVLRGIGSVFPHVAGAVGQMWNAVRNATE